MKKVLRHGYTTGACAAAAAKGAAEMLRNQLRINEVSIDLPAGVCATFPLHGQHFSATSASCFVIKDAGDDPDVTNGAEVHATVRLNPPQPPFSKGGSDVVIEGGEGIGRATKPGLAVAPGEWAINPVPRRMITEAIGEVFPPQCSPLTPHVTISIPDGELRAEKTLNARLGIIGGLSILGTSGIVRPISAKAWTDTIDAALDVARACACETVVFSTGRNSEMAVQKLFETGKRGLGTGDPDPSALDIEPLPEEAYVMMGDHVAHALRSSRERGFMRPLVACQFAKLLKIACGYENTHAAASEMDLARLRGWAEEERLSPALLDLIANANTAREIAVATAFDPALLALAGRKAAQAASSHAAGINPLFLVADYNGHIVAVL